MTEEERLLEKRFAELILWEKTKRRESLLISVFFSSALISLFALAARGWLLSWVGSLAVFPICFFVLALIFFLWRRWNRKDAVRTVCVMDRSAGLQERAVTAWEALGRRTAEGTYALVFREAADRLRSLDFKALLRRKQSWQAFAAPVVFLLWLCLAWLDVGVRLNPYLGSTAVSPWIQKLVDFSLAFKQKAGSQGLTESLKVAHALENAADKSRKGEVSKAGLGANLADLLRSIDETTRRGKGETDLIPEGVTKGGLEDLKAELASAKSSLLSSRIREDGGVNEEFLEKLSAMPRLKEELGKRLAPSREWREADLSSFLDKLEQQLSGELDRRTLLEAQEFLSNFMRDIEAGDLAAEAQNQGQRIAGDVAEGEKKLSPGSLPGDQMGKMEGPENTSRLPGRAALQLKGIPGDGKSDTLSFKAESKGKGSKVTEEDILASYVRQAERELAGEQIPEDLKETVKRYFLSLGTTGEKE
ncbi:MAG: hypothetical protein HY695_29335 [Deltaproteobacteria bacterium]|nr:hypothetical protein [Deltaproteobacteria bacterium]